MQGDELRSAAEAIRVDLPSLIDDPAERAAIDADLAHALDEPPDTARDALRRAIASHAVTRKWMRLRAEIEPDRAIGLPGGPTARLGVLFVCPKLDYSFVLETSTDEVPVCPNDGSVLERQDP